MNSSSIKNLAAFRARETIEDSIIKSLPDSNKTQAGQSVSLRLKSWFTQDSDLTGVLRGGGLVFLLSVAGFALGYLSQVALARWLGPKQFGIYAYAWSWIRLLAVFGTFGLAQAMLRFFPQYTANKDWTRAAGLLRYGRAMVFCVATLIALGAAAATTASIAIKNIVTFIFVKHRLRIHSFVFFAPQTLKSN